MSGSVNLCELFGDELETSAPDIRIIATPEEHGLINKVLMDFVSEPLAYDLSEMCPEEEMSEMAALCEGLRKELQLNYNTTTQTAYASGISQSKLATGTEKLIGGATTWLMVLAPVVAGLLVIYFILGLDKKGLKSVCIYYTIRKSESL